MQHTFYAVFDRADDAAATLRELERIGTPRKHCGIVVHGHTLDAESLHSGESGLRTGVIAGAATTGALGALLGGLVMGPAGLAAAGIAIGALYGAAAGGAMGAIAGASGPDPRLAALARDLAPGQVLLTVEAPNLTCEENAEAIITRHHGRVAHRRGN